MKLFLVARILVNSLFVLCEIVVDKGDTNWSQYFDESINFIDEAKIQGGGMFGSLLHGKMQKVPIISHLGYISMIILVYSSGNRLNESEKFILQILGKKMHINQIVPFQSDYCFCLSNEKAWHELISSYRALLYPGSSCPDKKTDAQMVSGSIRPVF